MALRRLAFAVAGLMACVLVAACSGDGGSSLRGAPTLRSSPLPTVEPPSPTPPICEPGESVAVPENFPSDEVPIPPDFVGWEVTTEPHLRLVGTVSPPEDVSLPPHGVAIRPIVDLLRGQGWTPMLNPRVSGQDWDLTAPDGRVLHVNASVMPECPGQVRLTYDVYWVTP